MHTSKILTQGRNPIRGPGKWQGFKLLRREHRGALELDFGLPTRLVTSRLLVVSHSKQFTSDLSGILSESGSFLLPGQKPRARRRNNIILKFIDVPAKPFFVPVLQAFPFLSSRHAPAFHVASVNCQCCF